ncbi:hypothetical protein OKW38_001334 [Paraburkholderia sp. MM5496-R1]
MRRSGARRRNAPQDRIREQRDVVDTLAHRGQMNRKRTDPEIQIGTELAVRDHPLERLVRGRDEPEVGAQHIGTAHAPEGARFDQPQQLHLNGQRHVALYRSIQRILGLAPQTRLYLCQDYQPGGRPLLFETTVAQQRERNIHVHDGVDEASFIAMRTARDATLAMPVLILPSVQVNMRAGHLPPPESDGVSYIKVPVDAL